MLVNRYAGIGQLGIIARSAAANESFDDSMGKLWDKIQDKTPVEDTTGAANGSEHASKLGNVSLHAGYADVPGVKQADLSIPGKNESMLTLTAKFGKEGQRNFIAELSSSQGDTVGFSVPPTGKVVWHTVNYDEQAPRDVRIGEDQAKKLRSHAGFQPDAPLPRTVQDIKGNMTSSAGATQALEELIKPQ